MWRKMLGILGLVCLTTGVNAQERITVFAAASLGDVLSEAAENWTEASGVDVTIVAVGSATLARQVAAGAGADAVLPASSDWMDWMEAQGVIRPGTRRDVMGNALVLVAHGAGQDSTLELSPDFDLIGPLGADGRLAMALTAAVPAGQYGRQALEALEIWPQVADRLAETDNVRAALALVALGEAPLGVVYATDAAAETDVHVLARFPEVSHVPIRYPGAVTRDSAAPDAALAFLDWLGTTQGRAVIAQHGFVLPSE